MHSAKIHNSKEVMDVIRQRRNGRLLESKATEITLDFWLHIAAAQLLPQRVRLETTRRAVGEYQKNLINLGFVALLWTIFS
jgi:hypothetical protein